MPVLLSSHSDIAALGSVLVEIRGWAHGPGDEAALAARHLTESTLVLYDVTSTYFDGCTWPGCCLRILPLVG